MVTMMTTASGSISFCGKGRVYIMRDPVRFAKLSLLFLNVWRDKYPELRFIQFVHFLVSKYHDGSDAFYVEDETVIDWLEQELKKGE
jgi:hypothetical protein